MSKLNSFNISKLFIYCCVWKINSAKHFLGFKLASSNANVSSFISTDAKNSINSFSLVLFLYMAHCSSLV